MSRGVGVQTKKKTSLGEYMYGYFLEQLKLHPQTDRVEAKEEALLAKFVFDLFSTLTLETPITASS